MEVSDESTRGSPLAAKAKKSGRCSYCMQRDATQMVRVTGRGTSFRRWMCGLCILKRQRKGIVRTLDTGAYVKDK